MEFCKGLGVEGTYYIVALENAPALASEREY